MNTKRIQSVGLNEEIWETLYELAFLTDLHSTTGLLLKSLRAEKHRQTDLLEMLEGKVNHHLFGVIERLFHQSITLMPDDGINNNLSR